MLTYVSLSDIIQFFFRVPLNVLVRTPGWQTLACGTRLLTVVWVHTGPSICIAVSFLAVRVTRQNAVVIYFQDRIAGKHRGHVETSPSLNV